MLLNVHWGLPQLKSPNVTSSPHSQRGLNMLITRCDKSITGQKVKGTVTDIAKTYSPQPHWVALSSGANFNPLRSSWRVGPQGPSLLTSVVSCPLPTPSPGIREAKGAAWAEAGTTCDPTGREKRTGPGRGGRTCGPPGCPSLAVSSHLLRPLFPLLESEGLG